MINTVNLFDAVGTLREEEAKIDTDVLHQISRDEVRHKSDFKKTVIAVHNIVNNKLYKEKSPSLEAYFKEKYHISRAQVYRLYNCAKELIGFDVLPYKEKICRSLKKIAKTKEYRRTLWKAVLERIHYEENLITTTVLSNVWQDLVNQGKVISSTTNSNRDDDDSQDESELMMMSPPNLSNFNSNVPSLSGSVNVQAVPQLDLAYSTNPRQHQYHPYNQQLYHHHHHRNAYPPPLPPPSNQRHYVRNNEQNTQVPPDVMKQIDDVMNRIEHLRDRGVSLEVLTSDNVWRGDVRNFRFKVDPERLEKNSNQMKLDFLLN